MAASGDAEVDAVVEAILALDPDGTRTAAVLRQTLDQLYDGQRTGRYRWDQLHKTEKTHCGTLVEINMQREFLYDDGRKLDYRIADIEVDCKYSQALWGWMIPREAKGEICMVLWADDVASVWSLGVIRTSDAVLGLGRNQDKKASISLVGRSMMRWLFEEADLPPNVLLQLPRPVVDEIMSGSSGAERIRRLFRTAQRMLVGRGVVATVGQQADYMKRIRENGGARTQLRPEGIIILGQYESDCRIAAALGLPVPGSGESVSARVTPAAAGQPGAARIGGEWWRLAEPADDVVEAPRLPKPRKGEADE